jgi:hypothetical protein
MGGHKCGAGKGVRAMWRLRPFERMADELEAMANELEEWATDDTTAEQCARLGALAATLHAAAQDLVETLGSES